MQTIRSLYLEKENLRKKMSVLWDKRDNGDDWTPDDRKSYEELASKADKVKFRLKN